MKNISILFKNAHHGIFSGIFASSQSGNLHDSTQSRPWLDDSKDRLLEDMQRNEV